LTKIVLINERIDGLRGKNCSQEDFLKLKSSLSEFITSNGDEFTSLRQYFNSKLTLKGDKEWLKKVVSKLKEAWCQFESKERDRNEAILSKKVIIDSQCGSCDKQIKELSPEKSRFKNWNRMEADRIGRSDASRSISNFGKG